MKTLSTRSFALCLFILVTTLCSAQAPTEGCTSGHQGVFTAGESNELVKVVIKGNRHMELHNDGKQVVKSKMDWVNECEYNRTIMHVTLKEYPYQVGDVVNVKINKVEGDKIYYTARVPGEAAGWQGILTKLTGQ